MQRSNIKNQNYNSKSKIDLKVRCYKFSLDLIKFIDNLPNKKSCWVISDQLLRSGLSVGANIVEAKSASSRLEFKRYFEISLKSANETKYWLGLLRDSKISNKENVDPLLAEVTEISNILGSSIISLKGKKLNFNLIF